MAFRVPAPDGTKAADGLPVMVLPPNTELQAGYRLNYLAVGGMSVVYRAEGLRAGKPPVVFAKEVASSESREVVALVQEKSILERLRHPGVVAVHELFEEDGFYYLLTDFIEGESLDRLISPFPGTFLQEKVVFGWGSELADIFAYLHRQDPPIVYRDLKPRNVMKDRGGKLHLVDFGIARYHKEGKAKDTESLGTAATASPEHYMGQTDHRSDIFTLGATLHFLLSNGSRQRRAPFEFPPIRSLNPQVSEQAEAVLQKCLQVDPAQRYPTMDALRQALDRCLGRPQPVTYVRAGEPLPYVESGMVTAPLPPPAAPGPAQLSATPFIVALALLLGLGGGLLAGRRNPAPVAASSSPVLETPLAVVVVPAETPGTPVYLLPSPAPRSPVSRPPVVRATPPPRPLPSPRWGETQAVATPRPVAVVPAPPSYPVHRPTPRPVPTAEPGPEPAAPQMPPVQGEDRFFKAPWFFIPRGQRTAVEGEPGPGGIWVAGDGFRMVVPAGFEQVTAKAFTGELLFVQGVRREAQVLRIRWREGIAENVEGMVRRFVAENPQVPPGDVRTQSVMGSPALRWAAEHRYVVEADFSIRTQALFWQRGGRSYILSMSARAPQYPQEEFEAVIRSVTAP